MTPREAFGQVLADVRRMENRAIVSSTPSQWSYFAEMADQLALTMRVYGSTDDDGDAAVVNGCRALIRHAVSLSRIPLDDGSGAQAPANVARAWALSIYAERILRLSGMRVPRRSLAWLRARRRWSDDGSPLVATVELHQERQVAA